MDFFVGTFNTRTIHTVRFEAPADTSSPGKLKLIHSSPAVGSHSWLSLSAQKDNLYATAWTTPPSVAAYRVHAGSLAQPPHVELLNTANVRATSGYVCNSSTHIYSVSGPSGEVFAKNPSDGAIGGLVQEISFLDKEAKTGRGAEDAHGDFGGLRHGAHSVDLSPDQRSLYIADIGRNCIWTYHVGQGTNSDSDKANLTLASKHISPRSNDGPRHTTPHPSGRVLYSVQEHSGMIDVFRVDQDGVSLTHLQGASIMPEGKDPRLYWADEVRLGQNFLHGSKSGQGPPSYLYASTRGLEPNTKGFVAVFMLDELGQLVNTSALDIYETATSGGIANAVEPAPLTIDNKEEEFLALTDSQEGWVFVLGFDKRRIREVARLKLTEEGYEVVKAATAVWL